MASGALQAGVRALLSRGDLSAEECRASLDHIMAGGGTNAEIGAWLALLAQRLPTTDELTGGARAMRAHALPVPTRIARDRLLDTAGTGGAPKTFNVSTVAALIAAGAGARVAKHGNRSRTGRGSADVLQRLGVNLDASTEQQVACLEQVGICFSFAVHRHPGLQRLGEVRRSLGVPTLLNVLGPLTNPAGAGRQMVGVYHAELLQPVARTLAALGSERAIVVHSEDGLDEVSISAPTQLVHVQRGDLTFERVAPEDFGLRRAEREQVTARDLDHAVSMVEGILEGRERGPMRDMAVLSSAVALVAAGRARDVAEGVATASAALDDGAALAKLRGLATHSHACPQPQRQQLE